MAFDNIPRVNCFSLGDFHSFEKCYFDFLVKHHLQKKYEIADSNENMAIGCLLDLAIKKLHLSKAYDQPLDYLLQSLFKAAEIEMREQAEREGPNSFYGATVKFLTPEVREEAQKVFKNYFEKRKGKINKAILNKRFWQTVLEGDGSASSPLKVWGGPDALEMGDDGVPEIVDYKYFEDSKRGKENLDMDLMPKLYTLLCAEDILKMGFKKARFRIRSLTDPEDESLYEEFDLGNSGLLKDFFRHNIEKILSKTEISFCEKVYCKSCKSDSRDSWLAQLKVQFNFN